MQEFLDHVLSFIGDLLWGGFTTVASFLLYFFPDADPSIVQTIESWGQAVSGFDITFNVFYFVDMPIVAAFLAVTLVVMLALIVFTFVRVIYELITDLIQAVAIAAPIP